MSQLYQAASPVVQGQINELIEEIAFQRVLLESMDDTVVNRQQAELDVRKEIRDLENQVKRLRRGTTAGTPTASNSLNTISSQAPEVPTQEPSPKINSEQLASPPEAPMDGFRGERYPIQPLLFPLKGTSSRRFRAESANTISAICISTSLRHILTSWQVQINGIHYLLQRYRPPTLQSPWRILSLLQEWPFQVERDHIARIWMVRLRPTKTTNRDVHPQVPT